MSGSSYRPRADNGSGDSPRPPFLTEFVNQVGEIALVELVYHLIGGTLAVRVHPHVERSFRLKAESARRIPELQRADADVCQHPVHAVRWDGAGDLGKAAMQQGHLRPIRRNLRGRTAEVLARQFERAGILIEGNQTTLCAQASCDFQAVPA